MKIFENLDEIKQKAKGLEEKVGQTIGDIEEKIGQSVEVVETKVDLPEIDLTTRMSVEINSCCMENWQNRALTGGGIPLQPTIARPERREPFCRVLYDQPGTWRGRSHLGQTEENQKKQVKPSYMMVKVGRLGRTSNTGCTASSHGMR